MSHINALIRLFRQDENKKLIEGSGKKKRRRRPLVCLLISNCSLVYRVREQMEYKVNCANKESRDQGEHYEYRKPNRYVHI